MDGDGREWSPPCDLAAGRIPDGGAGVGFPSGHAFTALDTGALAI